MRNEIKFIITCLIAVWLCIEIMTISNDIGGVATAIVAFFITILVGVDKYLIPTFKDRKKD